MDHTGQEESSEVRVFIGLSLSSQDDMFDVI